MARGCSRFTTGLAGAVESTVNAKEDGKVRKHEVLELMHVSEDVYRKNIGRSETLRESNNTASKRRP